jgi:tRNA A-37 threonylcarbamoyl transferase component Bud32
LKKTHKINTLYRAYEVDIDMIISNFNTSGVVFGKQARNTLKLFDLGSETLNVKSFRIPNLINKIVYRFLRKSKAQRSFEYAEKLLELGISTPKPIAYYEFSSPIFFNKSFYISEHLECDFTFRALTKDFNIKNHEFILRAFTRFTYQLHEKGVHFLDHSPGNTLIKETNNGYDFYLVDLNRMEFGALDLETRLKNFAKLTIHKSIIQIISNEYAKCTGLEEEKVFNSIWQYTRDFQDTFYKKRRLKARVFFWKKKYKNRENTSPIQ